MKENLLNCAVEQKTIKQLNNNKCRFLKFRFVNMKSMERRGEEGGDQNTNRKILQLMQSDKFIVYFNGGLGGGRTKHRLAYRVLRQKPHPKKAH